MKKERQHKKEFDMPYILKERRPKIEPLVLELSKVLESRGDYNYGKRYKHVNDAQGIIDCVGKEFYRVVTAPYENIKRRENGPVSSVDSDFIE